MIAANTRQYCAGVSVVQRVAKDHLLTTYKRVRTTIDARIPHLGEQDASLRYDKGGSSGDTRVTAQKLLARSVLTPLCTHIP